MKLSTHILFSVLALGTLPLLAGTPISEDNYSAAQDILYDAIDKYVISSGSQEEERYFYHSDHLGSANWITDADGVPVQYIHYAPYGELIANQMATGYDERYKFTGKERDAAKTEFGE